MNSSIPIPELAIEVNQCLFGYLDGHRLLATSQRLPEDALSTLLLLSDLTPGVHLPHGEGYWTGIPLVNAKTYALMRTWLAPEMPRPGCVWTHVLLISFSDVARISDFSLLVELLARPESQHSVEKYVSPIRIKNRVPSQFPSTGRSVLDQSEALRKVIRAIYTPDANGRVVCQFGALDAAIFSVWSQQWPRLRRSFSFRTAVGFSDSATTKPQFDLVVEIDKERRADFLEGPASRLIDGWESVCIADLLSGQGGEFRQFIWRYGSDIRNGLRRFGFLAEIFTLTRVPRLKDRELRRVLAEVGRILPNDDDGRLLKDDLIGQNEYSLLPAPDLVDMLAVCILEPSPKKRLVPPIEALGKLGNYWPARTKEILSIAETASTQKTTIAKRFIEVLATLIDEQAVFSLTINSPQLRRKLFELDPSLLDNDEIATLPELELLSYLPIFLNDGDLVSKIAPRLVSVERPEVAAHLIDRYPLLLARVVILKMELYFDGVGSPVTEYWLRSAVSRGLEVFLDPEVIKSARSTRTLAFLATSIGYDSAELFFTDPIDWIAGLDNARDTVMGEERLDFLLFLLRLALEQPIHGSERIFEFAFEEIHSAVIAFQLSLKQISRLNTQLPVLGWIDNLDTGLRLRSAVARAYVNNNLNLKRLKKLTRDPSLATELSDLARTYADPPVRPKSFFG